MMIDGFANEVDSRTNQKANLVPRVNRLLLSE